MREIKFRAWDSKNKKYAFTDFYLLGEVMLFDLLSMYSIEEHCDLLIEQFTGRKDNDGVDIYEGDIVEVEWRDAMEKMNATVVWSKSGAGFDLRNKLIGTLSISYAIFSGDETFKVIGNIHNNPELLEK